MRPLESIKNFIKQLGNLGAMLSGFKLLDEGKNLRLDSLMGVKTILDGMRIVMNWGVKGDLGRCGVSVAGSCQEKVVLVVMIVRIPWVHDGGINMK
jgi:hypothetical protein